MEDRRIKHTKKAILEAMTECLKTESLDKVTVKRICEIADINRSTFYTYYTDPIALYHAMEKDFVRGLNEYVVKLDGDKASYREFLSQLVGYVFQNSGLYQAFILTNSTSLRNANSSFLSKYNLWKQNLEPSTEQYLEEFIMTGTQSVLLKWISGGKKESTEQIAELIYQFTLSVTNSRI